MALFARCVGVHRKSPSIHNRQLVVLSQRIVLERTRSYFHRKGEMDRINGMISRVLRDPDYCRAIESRLEEPGELGRRFPQYVEAKLLSQ